MPLASRTSRTAGDAAASHKPRSPAPHPRSASSWAVPLRIAIATDHGDWARGAVEALAPHGVQANVVELDIAADDERLDPCRLVLIKPARLSGDCWAACLRLGERADRAVVLLHESPNVPDTILALELGADDCFAASLDPGEVAARLRALVRRVSRSQAVQEARETAYYFAGWRFAPATAELRGPSGRTYRLHPCDQRLLATLVSRPGEAFSPRDLTDLLGPETRDSNDWRVRICRLRARLSETEPDVDWLRTVRGRGYAIDARVLCVEEPLSFTRPTRHVLS